MHEKYISVKSGYPPGVPIYIGKQEANNTTFSIIWYDEKNVQVLSHLDPDTIELHPDKKQITWIHVSGLRDIDQLNRFFSKLALHPLIIEDIFNTKGRAKIEDFDDSLFIVLEMVNSPEEEWYSQKINIIVKNGILISVSESGDPFCTIRERITHPNGKFRSYEIDYLMYSLVDLIVDSFFYALERIEESAETLEDKVLKNPNPEIVREIQSFRHDLITFRRQVWSLREVVMHLERSESVFLKDTTRVFMRDVYDHVIKITEDLDMHREMAEGIMEIYLSSISNRTNDIVRTLTVITVIFIPLTFITGIYGMNFTFLPGINDPDGHILIMSMMTFIASFMVILFKWKKWI